jgi:hypothetical protein
VASKSNGGCSPSLIVAVRAPLPLTAPLAAAPPLPLPFGWPAPALAPTLPFRSVDALNWSNSACCSC